MQDAGGLRYFTWDKNGMNLLCDRGNLNVAKDDITDTPAREQSWTLGLWGSLRPNRSSGINPR